MGSGVGVICSVATEDSKSSGLDVAGAEMRSGERESRGFAHTALMRGGCGRG